MGNLVDRHHCKQVVRVQKDNRHRVPSAGIHWEGHHIFVVFFPKMGFPGGSVVKNPPANAGNVRDVGSISRSGRSPGGGNGSPLQYSHRKFHGQGHLAGYSPWSCKESDMTEHAHASHTHTHTHTQSHTHTRAHAYAHLLKIQNLNLMSKHQANLNSRTFFKMSSHTF